MDEWVITPGATQEWGRNIDRILNALGEFRAEMRHLMSVLDDKIAALNAEVTRNKTIKDSVVVLINGIPALINDAVSKALAAGATQTQLQAFSDLSNSLTANDDELAASVQSNTPAPPPAPTPAPAGGTTPATGAPAS